MLSSIDARKTVRIPLFSRVRVRGEIELGPCFTSNISRGGLHLHASGASPAEVAVGSIWWVNLNLPGLEPLDVVGEVAWVDAGARDAQGRMTLAFGLRFSEDQEKVLEAVARFVAEFRYRVCALGADEVVAPLGEWFRIERVASEEEALAALGAGRVDLLVHGENGTSDGGAGRLKRILGAREVAFHPPIVCCASKTSAELERMVSGSNRVVFLSLPISPLALRSVAERLVEGRALALEVDALTHQLRQNLETLERENRTLRLHVPSPRLPGMVGDCAPMRKVYDWVERVAPVDTTVLLLGESGTGKDRVARAIHALSPRAQKAYVAQNCAALAESLLDAELFGHVRGAFTGAIKERAGLIESAEGGTLFLDEVGEMSPLLQAKLLRVLQEREVRRIGSTKDVPVNVRVLCATHRDLAALVRVGRFREDLYYRIRAFVIAIPPLRDRREDIGPLAAHFLERFATRHDRHPSGFSPEAIAALERHPWPGNVRELELTVERLVVLSDPGRPIDAGRVGDALGAGTSPSEAKPEPTYTSLEAELEGLERQRILAELARAGGVVARAARALGMDRTTLSKRCKRLGVPTRMIAGGEG